MAKTKKAIQESQNQPKNDLVLMAKNGSQLEVHKSCVKAHQSKGWLLVEGNGDNS